MTPHRDLERLARTVKARRIELGLARNRTAQAHGMSKDTWQRVEDARPVRDMNYAKIDRALGWVVGSCILVAEGGEPIPAEPSEAMPGAMLASLPPTDLEAAIDQAVKSASIGVTDLSAPEIRKLSAEVLRDLRDRGVI